MKKFTLFLFIFTFAIMPISAQSNQHPDGRQHKHRNVADMVDDLSSSQRKKLIKVQQDAHVKIDALHTQLGQVRDSIRTFSQLDGDNSKLLFPLFDREGMLQAQLSKEMYNLRISVDNILTPQQLAQFRKALQDEKNKQKRR